MGRSKTTLRLFVGIYPPVDETGTGAATLLGALTGLELPAHRVVRTDHVHLTVQFIGDVSSRELDRTIESISRSAAGLAAFSLRPLTLISLPARGPSRLIAVETDRPAPLLELKRRLASRFARTARARPDDRFVPHLTLCRFAGEVRLRRIDRPLELRPFEVRHVRVMRSTLEPAGAVHHELERIELGV